MGTTWASLFEAMSMFITVHSGFEADATLKTSIFYPVYMYLPVSHIHQEQPPLPQAWILRDSYQTKQMWGVIA